MKPIVVVVDDKLTKENIEEIIDKAYSAGWSDGYNAGKALDTYYPFNPQPVIYTDKTIPTFDPNKITCSDIEECLKQNSVQNIIDEYILKYVE